MNSFEVLTNALSNIGLSENDDVLVISNLSNCGIVPELRQELAKTPNFYYDAIRKTIGNGTIIVPSYSFDFIKSKEYIHEKTSTNSGIFNEFIRTHKNTTRSFHPMASFSAIGDNAKFYMNNEYISGWGLNSPVERMLQNNVKCLILGLCPVWIPIYHYFEQSCGVPYGYTKILSGDIYKNDLKVEKEFTAFLRYKHLDINYRIKEMEDEILSNINYKAQKLFKSKATLYDLEELGNFIKKMLLKDVHYFLKNKPNYSSDKLPLL